MRRGALLLAIAVASCSKPAPEQAAPTGPSVSAGGLSLVSASIALPDDPAHFPPGPGAELAEARCTACHSASMPLTQPAMDAEKWGGVIKKMRETYGATVEDAEVPILTAYLARISGGAGGSATTGGPADAHGRPSSQAAKR